MSAESLTTAATLFAGPDIATNTTPSSNGGADFRFVLDGKVQTLSTHNAPNKGPIKGLLFVPSLDPNDPCNNITAPFVPSNVTRKEDILSFGRQSIALAPWVSADCTQSFLDASRRDEPDALVFFLPSSTSPAKPPASDNSAWAVGDGAWKDQTEYPVYAIPGPDGRTLMQRLSWYSENTTSGHNSSAPQDLHANENVRLFTFIDLAKSEKKMPSLWGFVLAILGTVLVLSVLLLFLYQFVQKKRRARLQRRIESGEADLEFLGLNQMKVPRDVLDQLPMYTYTDLNAPPAVLLTDHSTKPFPDSHGSITTITEDPEDKEIGMGNGSQSRLQEPQPATTTTTTTHQVIPTSASEYRLNNSQTTCAICLDDYESGLSVVREMPCGHIFDVDCIDTFLTQNSSLCPLCKKSVLPTGSYPIPVTNIMVQRDYIQRRSG